MFLVGYNQELILEDVKVNVPVKDMNERENVIFEEHWFSPEVKLMRCYGEFEVKIACDLRETGLNDETASLVQVMNDINNYVVEFDLTEEYVISLSELYEDNIQYLDFLERKKRNLCLKIDQLISEQNN